MSISINGQPDTITRIGEAAGQVWQTLSDQGPLTVTKLVKEVGEPRDVVLQALGWLAREDKLAFEEKGRTKVVRLREA